MDDQDGRRKTNRHLNAVGPEKKQTMMGFVEEASKSFDVESKFTKIDDGKFLKENGVPYLVPWINPEGNNYGSSRASNKKGKKAGLTFRDLHDSMKDTYQWWYSDALTDERRNKFEQKPDSVLLNEKSILEKWKTYKK